MLQLSDYLCTSAVMQGPHLCDFETWKEWKKSPIEEVKLKIRLEMEKAKSSSQRHSDSAADIAEGIMRSGLLYDSLRQHLSHALNKRQSKLQTLHKSNAQFFQVASVLVAQQMCLYPYPSYCYTICLPPDVFPADVSCTASNIVWVS